MEDFTDRPTESRATRFDLAPSRRIACLLMLLTALLALGASALGLLQPSLYRAVVASGQITPFLLMGSIVQDIISLPAALLLAAGTIACLRGARTPVFAAMLGLTGYFCYGYALYAIQGQYTAIYPAYLGILGLSTFGLIYGLADLEQASGSLPVLPKAIRLAAGIFLTVILAVLVPAWLGRMAPDILRNRAGEVYGVFVLDLGLVFPAFAIIAARLYRARRNGTPLAIVAMVKTFTLCLSVALGEWLKPAFGFSGDPAMIAIFTTLTVVSAILLLLIVRHLRQPA